MRKSPQGTCTFLNLGLGCFSELIRENTRPNYKAEIVVEVYFTRSNCGNTKCKFELETFGEKSSPLVLQEQLEYKI